MDAATRDRNIATWLGDAPQPVRDTTNQLLERIALLRAEQTIYPAQDDILNALAYTPADQVKVVILGQDPYHGPNQAMGLSFSVPATQTKLPPSLRNIYKELKADLGCPIPATGDLTPWAQQGVLLLNTTLTVREHAANSHAKLGWSTLTDYVIHSAISWAVAQRLSGVSSIIWFHRCSSSITQRLSGVITPPGSTLLAMACGARRFARFLV